MRMEKGPGGRFQNLLVLNKKLQEKRRTMHVRKCGWTQMLAVLRVVDGGRGLAWWSRVVGSPEVAERRGDNDWPKFAE